MNKIVVLGGAGVVGSYAARTLALEKIFQEIVIADYNLTKAKKKLDGLPGLSFVHVDVTDPQELSKALTGADIVLNCIGPFYKTVKQVLHQALDLGITYIDVCDDVDVTQEIFKLDALAKKLEITAIIGLGNSPGITNIFAKYAADNLLDQTEAINIYHAHGGEPEEGLGVIGHRFHCMSIPIPMYLDGKMQYVNFFEPSGLALRKKFNFPLIGECTVYPYPHPEQVTLPQYIQVQQVTNRGVVLPEEYYALTRELCRLGLNAREPLTINDGQKVSPYDFALHFIHQQREKILKETQFGEQRGCCTVEIKGQKQGKAVIYHFHIASQEKGLGEGTGIPAAMGVMLLAQGKIRKTGVLPPEACVDPEEFINLAPTLKVLQESGEDPGNNIFLEQINDQGEVKKIPFF